jgi:hypothetical protein
MLTDKFLTILIQLCVVNHFQLRPSHGFYYTKFSRDPKKGLPHEKYNVLEDFRIDLDDPLNDSKDNTSFPIFIHVEFTHAGRFVSLKFIKSLIVGKKGAHFKSSSMLVLKDEPIENHFNSTNENQNRKKLKNIQTKVATLDSEVDVQVN